MNIIFLGDFAPCRGFEEYILEKKSFVWDGIKDDILKSDISFVNLETPLTTGSKPIKKSGPNIKAHPDCIRPIADAGFSVVGLANNHILDFGEQGLEETLGVCQKAGLATCGAGKSLPEAQQPLVIEKGGIKIGFIAVAEHEFSIAEKDRAGAAPLDPIDNSLLIENLRKDVDLLFVTIHGGNEYFSYPRPGLRKICRFYVDKGADAVICHHAHVPGAYEVYKNKPIVYSLGNLIFDHPNPPEGWNQGYAFRLEYDRASLERTSFELIPYTQSVEQGGVRKMEGEQKEDFLRMIENYRSVLNDPESYKGVWDEFCESREDAVLLRMFFPYSFRGLGRLAKILPLTRCVLPKSIRLERKNMVNCEAHHELLINILEKKC